MAEKYQDLVNHAATVGAAMSRQAEGHFTGEVHISREDDNFVLKIKDIGEFKIISKHFSNVEDFGDKDYLEVSFVDGQIIRRTDSVARTKVDKKTVKATKGAGCSVSTKAF